MAETRARNIWHYRPGEMVVATELAEDETVHRQAHGIVQQAIEAHLAGRTGGVFHAAQRRTDPLVFRAPGRPPLGFLFYDLAEPSAHDFVKQVVHAAHANDLAALEPARQAGMAPLGVMPHWLGSAQSNYSDGSPATLPRPARPPRRKGRWAYRYTPAERALDFRPRLEQVRARAQVPVLVLDTMPNWTRARRQAAVFSATNRQLEEMVDVLSRDTLPDWNSADIKQRDDEGLKLARTPDGRARAHDMADHGLFIAGLIHDLSPRADVRLRPVLNRYGVGDLHLLMRVLEHVINSKRVDEPLVINMSLGFVPKLEQLPWIWFGVDPANDADFVSDVAIRGERRDRAWLAGNRDEVEQTTRLLHAGLDRLSRYLLANNTLGVAAAGNDSLRRVETGRPRLGPRVPARYESILGVAATTRDASTGAPYSNVGDVLEFGDHVATFGGDVTANDEPRDGVIGVFSAPTFPARGGEPAPKNETGFASWSGTSFATGIASGLVSGYWSVQRNRKPATHAEEILVGFSTLASNYAPALSTPSVPVDGAWRSY